MLSTLDVISNGRAELGIGAGWYEQEYIAYGYDFPSNVIRIKQLNESLNIIKAMWTKKRSSFEGNYFKVKDVICNPKPIQNPYPTIMVGGQGEKYMLKVVAKHADRYNLFFGSPQEMKRKISLVKEYCNSIGRNHNEIQYSVVLPCILIESEEKVNQTLIEYKRKDKTIQEYIQYLAGGITVGTPEKIVKGLNEYVNIGVSHFVIHFIKLDEKILKEFKLKVISKV